MSPELDPRPRSVTPWPRACLVAAGVGGAVLLSGCYHKDGSVGEQRLLEAVWRHAPGTQGFINLDEVKQAFQARKTVESFAERVNEIYEGEQLVVLDAQPIDGGKKVKLEAREDLDGDGKVEKTDDLLFTMTLTNGQATLEGAGVNSYYKDSWKWSPTAEEAAAGTVAGTASDTTSTGTRRSGGFFFLWFGRPFGGYSTPMGSRASMLSKRNGYRQTSGFTSQVKTNQGFAKANQARYGSGFSKTSGMSSARRGFISRTTAKQGFGSSLKSRAKSSGWGKSVSSRPSGFRGGSRASGGAA